MTYRCFLAALVSGVLLLSLAACDDSSTVGLGVGPDTLAGGQPVVLDVSPDPFGVRQNAEGPPVTSNVRSDPQGGHRILVGSVTDPLVGTITTRGHIDFARPPGVDTVETIVSVDLVLEPNYKYGSTTDQQTVTVHSATNEIVDSLRANSTALGVGAEITSGSFVSEDTLVSIPMTDGWIAANRTELLNTSDDPESGYDARFPGLVIAPSSGNHVMGFNRRASRLRMIADFEGGARDTIEYAGSKSFTYIERSGTPDVPEGTELLVDGVGDQLATNIDFDAAPFDSLGLVPINRAEFVIPIDSMALEQSTPANFTRPELSPDETGFLMLGRLTEARRAPENLFRGQYRLCARLGQSVPTFRESCALTLQQSDDGLLVGTNVFQRVVEIGLEEDQPLFTEYTIEYTSQVPTITPILLRRPNPSAPDGNTRLQVTLVPQR